jgi:hypothetical protein
MENDGAVTRQGTSRRMRSEIDQSIDILDLARITHVVSMWALGELVTQIRHGDVGPILREQSINELPGTVALGSSLVAASPSE